MKILFISQSDSDGGASLAAFKLAESLKSLNIDITLIVMRKNRNLSWIKGPVGFLMKLLSKIFSRFELIFNLIFTKNNTGYWSFNFFYNPLFFKINIDNYDLIHLHWIGKNTLPLKLLSAINTTIVWTLHDSWPFTGGCHLPLNCKNYNINCQNCPQVRNFFQFLPKYQNDIKKLIFASKDISFIAPSKWMMTQARSSNSLLNNQIHYIPNGISTNKFQRVDASNFKRRNEINSDETVIVFGGYNAIYDPNKGFEILINALKNLKANNNDKYTVLTFGTKFINDNNNLPFRLINLGVINDQKLLNEIYSSACITAIPSFNESFGQMAVESFSCGTPVVAFKTTGLIDIVDHKVTGYLANPYDYEDFAAGINYIKCADNRSNMIDACKNIAVTKFDLIKVSYEHLELYNSLLNTK